MKISARFRPIFDFELKGKKSRAELKILQLELGSSQLGSDSYYYLPTSSCKRSLWTTPKVTYPQMDQNFMTFCCRNSWHYCPSTHKNDRGIKWNKNAWKMSIWHWNSTRFEKISKVRLYKITLKQYRNSCGVSEHEILI